MKKIILILLLPTTLTLLSLSPVFKNYTEYSPILMKRNTLNNSIKYTEAKQICNTGKIYFKDNYIFLNEKYQGIHIINNQNPQKPQNIGFIVIPGCIDIAIKNNILYADNAVDLVAIKLNQNYTKLSVVKRIKNTFPEIAPPDGKNLKPTYKIENRPENTIIIGWEKTNE